MAGQMRALAGHLAENAKQVVQLRWTTITYR